LSVFPGGEKGNDGECVRARETEEECTGKWIVVGKEEQISVLIL
jgi:hypothetical protein